MLPFSLNLPVVTTDRLIKSIFICLYNCVIVKKLQKRKKKPHHNNPLIDCLMKLSFRLMIASSALDIKGKGETISLGPKCLPTSLKLTNKNTNTQRKSKRRIPVLLHFCSHFFFVIARLQGNHSNRSAKWQDKHLYKTIICLFFPDSWQIQSFNY